MNALKKPEANVPQEDNTANQEPAQETQGLTEEQIRERLKTDPGFADVLLKDLDALDELKKAGALEEQPAAATEPNASEQQSSETPDAPQQPSFAEVKVKIDPSHLGTYAKNRSIEDAVAEAVKGNAEKDRMIGFLRNEKIPQQEQRISELAQRERTLRQEFEDYKKRHGVAPQATPAAQPQAAPAKQPAKIELPEIPEEPMPPDGPDFLDDEKRADYLKKVRERNDALAKRQKGLEQLFAQSQQAVNSLTGEITQLKEGVAKTQARVTERDTMDAYDANTRNEFAEIDRMRDSNREVFGEPARPTSQIEADWRAFLKDLAMVSGIPGSIYSEGTTLKPELLQKLDLYDRPDTADGKALRDACDTRAIRPPEDVDALNRVYAVRAVRNKYQVKDAEGNLVPIPYDEALRLSGLQPLQKRQPAPTPQAQSPQTPPTASSKLQQNVDLSNRRQSAVEKQAQFAKEPPLNGGASNLDVNSPAFQDRFKKAWSKKPAQWDEYDKEVLRRAYKAKDLNPEEFFPELAMR